MSEKEKGWKPEWISLGTEFLMGAVLFLFLMEMAVRADHEIAAIKAGVGRHHPQTGKFEPIRGIRG